MSNILKYSIVKENTKFHGLENNILKLVFIRKHYLFIYLRLATRPAFARVVEHIIGTNMFCLS